MKPVTKEKWKRKKQIDRKNSVGVGVVMVGIIVPFGE